MFQSLSFQSLHLRPYHLAGAGVPRRWEGRGREVATPVMEGRRCKLWKLKLWNIPRKLWKIITNFETYLNVSKFVITFKVCISDRENVMFPPFTDKSQIDDEFWRFCRISHGFCTPAVSPFHSLFSGRCDFPCFFRESAWYGTIPSSDLRFLDY